MINKKSYRRAFRAGISRRTSRTDGTRGTGTSRYAVPSRRSWWSRDHRRISCHHSWTSHLPFRTSSARWTGQARRPSQARNSGSARRPSITNRTLNRSTKIQHLTKKRPKQNVYNIEQIKARHAKLRGIIQANLEANWEIPFRLEVQTGRPCHLDLESHYLLSRLWCCSHRDLKSLV